MNNNTGYVDLNAKYIYKRLSDVNFDWSKIVIENPITKTSKDGSNTWVVSPPVYYAYNGPNGLVKLEIYFQAEKQRIWGIGGKWENAILKENQTVDNVEGYQVGYPMTSLNTVKCPTPTELETIKCFDQIWSITQKHVLDKCLEEDQRNPEVNATPKIPEGIHTQYIGVKQKAKKAKDDAAKMEVWKGFIKPTYSPTTIPDKTGNKNAPKVYDYSKPLKSYVDFVCFGGGTSGKPLKCDTKVRGPRNVEVNPKKYFSSMDNSIMGDAELVFKWLDLYWGGHGNASYKVSARLRVKELNFTPVTSSSLVSNQFLSPNVGNIGADDDSSNDDLGGGDDLYGGFKSPMGEPDDNDFNENNQTQTDLVEPVAAISIKSKKQAKEKEPEPEEEPKIEEKKPATKKIKERVNKTNNK